MDKGEIDAAFLEKVTALLLSGDGLEAIREFLRSDVNAFLVENGQETEAFFKREGYVEVRQCEDGTWIGMHRMGFNWRLSTGLTYGGIEDNYCYDDRDVCHNALLAFEPGRDLDPVGWKKLVETNRCRLNGDPALESIGWPLPP